VGLWVCVLDVCVSLVMCSCTLWAKRGYMGPSLGVHLGFAMCDQLMCQLMSLWPVGVPSSGTLSGGSDISWLSVGYQLTFRGPGSVPASGTPSGGAGSADCLCMPNSGTPSGGGDVCCSS
jgi:hypothetical protein